MAQAKETRLVSMKGKKWPMTLDEAIGVVLATLSEEEKSQITEMAAADLINLHFGLGASIRNNFGLWHDNQALIQAIDRHRPGIHPDDASMVIIEEVWKRLRERVPKLH
jgi:hypothetical protein